MVFEGILHKNVVRSIKVDRRDHLHISKTCAEGMVDPTTNWADHLNVPLYRYLSMCKILLLEWEL